MKKVLMFLWQLPQNIIALIAIMILKPVSIGCNIYEHDKKRLYDFAIGTYIFMKSPIRITEEYSKSLRHEMGHARQSELLGWLWIPVIAIPSVIHYWWYQLYGEKHGKDYYAFYTEKWANELND